MRRHEKVQFFVQKQPRAQIFTLERNPLLGCDNTFQTGKTGEAQRPGRKKTVGYLLWWAPVMYARAILEQWCCSCRAGALRNGFLAGRLLRLLIRLKLDADERGLSEGFGASLVTGLQKQIPAFHAAY